MTKEEILKEALIRMPRSGVMIYIDAKKLEKDVLPGPLLFAMEQYASQHSAALESENKRLRQALKEIEQMSDPGSYEQAIVDMKSIATEALNH